MKNTRKIAFRLCKAVGTLWMFAAWLTVGFGPRETAQNYALYGLLFLPGTAFLGAACILHAGLAPEDKEPVTLGWIAGANHVYIWFFMALLLQGAFLLGGRDNSQQTAAAALVLMALLLLAQAWGYWRWRRQQGRKK